MDWHQIPREERIEQVRGLAAKGFSAKQISMHFKAVSRNGIIGFMRRTGISLMRGQGDSRVENAINEKIAARVSKPVARVPLPSGKTVDASPILKIARKNAFDPLPGVPPMPIEDMPRVGRCRWPVNGAEGSSGIFCGSATAPATATYCTTHHHLSTH